MDRYLRINDVIQRLSIGKSTFFDWVNPKSSRFKPDFPKPVKIGRSTFYIESEINHYLQCQSANRTELHSPPTAA